MQIREPVDVMILQVLSDGEHANPVRTRHLIREQHGDDLGEWDRAEIWKLDYITQRMNELRKLELLERVPPDDSGLYKISDLGHVVLRRWVDTGEREFSFSDVVEERGDVTRDRVEPDAISPGRHA